MVPQRVGIGAASRLLMPDATNDLEVVGDVATVAAILDAATPTPTPTSAPIYERREHSVNGARVDNWLATSGALMRVQTQANPAGGFNGAGVGNKAILGHWNATPIPLATLSQLDYAARQLSPESTISTGWIPYMNLVVQLQPGDLPAQWAIFVLMDKGTIDAGLNVGAYTAQPNNVWAMGWVNGVNYVQVVGDVGMVTPPAGPVPVPVAEGTPVGSGTWQDRDFALSDILVAYPNAAIVSGPVTDNGLPFKTPMSGLLLVSGDSTTVAQNAVEVLTWNLNLGAI